ncbi:MAG: peptidoglycan DD-metalloendopeptidase family protein, partial [Actinomycetota bacterium]|nr:peptidoglycan DD-metalloendopeptidase family protein [Actinomycetota bacterium]
MGRTKRVSTLLVTAALILAPVSVAGAVPSGAGGEEQLVDLVARTAKARVAEDPRLASTPWIDTKVTMSRSKASRWVFGSVVLVAPKTEDSEPRDWLFVAERQDGQWKVGLDGQAAFAELSAASPVLSAEEKSVFAGHGGQPSTAVPGDYRTGMRLPWALNQSWSILGGPHAFDAGTGPWSSLDLAGGDQRVLAARDGLAYTLCTGLIRVMHPDGYASRYYHLWNHLQVDGRSVAAGTFLGDTGTETGCGGAARARHVHFSLMHNGAFIGIASHIIGKWVFRNGSAQYGGSALHGSTSVAVGGSITNYGVLGPTQGLVDANGDTAINRRSGPGTGHPVVGTVSDGATVDIRCSAPGTTHTGRWGSTSL